VATVADLDSAPSRSPSAPPELRGRGGSVRRLWGSPGILRVPSSVATVRRNDDDGETLVAATS
jgi:hypothetical protein